MIVLLVAVPLGMYFDICTEQVVAFAGQTAELGGRHLQFHNSHLDDSSFIRKQLHLIPGQADLEEPLERVHEALNETIKTVLTR